MKKATLQYQDLSGTWIDAKTIENLGYQYVLQELKMFYLSFGQSKRVRAIDEHGHLLDFLG